MEDKIIWNTDEFKTLGLEDLESAAGGVTLAQLTDEERRECKTLRKKLERSVIDKSKGLCDQAAVDAANREYVEFLVKMNKKYS